MRFATYEHKGTVRAAVLDADDALHPLESGTTIRALIEQDCDIRVGGALLDAGAAALDRPADLPVAEVRLLPPLHPASIRDSVSFEAHIEGARKSQEGAQDPVPARWYEAPCFYFTNPHACIGANDDVERFLDSHLFDLECEVGAVVGARGRNLDPEQAQAAIIGYTIFNDWSARDVQKLEGQLPFGFFKGKDGAHTLGPYLVTADELAPHLDSEGFLDLTMRACINDELLGEDSLANMAWTFGELVSFCARGSEIAPGDVIASGTCHRGCLTEIWGRAGERKPAPLEPGDVVTLTVEGIGTVRNRVVEPAAAPPIPRGRAGRPRGPRH
jgi:2-keto-4-pentenoate hydratase/2-oxohepta-3-ene-1,7-dioic acid hydratase in catechol pathway